MHVGYDHQDNCCNKGNERPFNVATHAALSALRCS
jgi:hypothetical protein